ncbi:MAG TPA: FeoA family protein [Candidatus Omnitrophota bacterium]|nr:FeoA family protein [Candidatus Omnitrophota bacterium]HPN88495.1 FeoA family protein [Candidatus Omnitrophota bacterium]
MIERKHTLLVEVKEGAVVKIYKIESGAQCRRRLIELGFRKGEDLKIIRNSLRGPVVVDIQGARIALGQKEARKIYVEEK